MKKIFLVLFITCLGITLMGQQREGLFFVMLNTNPNRAQLPQHEVDSLQRAHLQNIERLASEGIIRAAGPFQGGGGMFIINAPTRQQAQQYLDTDPAISANRFRVELFPLKIDIGAVCPVDDNYDMVEYQFVLYRPNTANDDLPTEKKLKRSYKRHIDYLAQHIKDNNIFAAGGFDGLGGFMVMKKCAGEDFDHLMQYDPWVRSENFTYDPMILWIARGSFCEQRVGGQ